MLRQATRSSHAGPAGLIDSAENDICDTLRVSRWVDPLIDRLGHDPRSRYAELFWLPILGPSTILFLRHCVTLLDEACAGADQDVEIELTTTATRLGLGHRGGRNSPMARTIGRASRFGAARPAGAQALQVRRYMPPLTRAQVNRLPAGLRARHQAETKPALAEEDVTSARARRLALGLIQCGDQHDAAETQLSQWQVPPAVAADAVRWAWDVYRPDRALGVVGNDAA